MKRRDHVISYQHDKQKERCLIEEEKIEKSKKKTSCK